MRWRRLILLAALAALAFPCLWLWRRADLEQALLRAERELAAATGLELSHRSMQVSWGRWLAVEIRGLALTDRRSSSVLLDADSVVMALELRRLLHGDVVFGDITVEHPRFRATRQDDGTLDVRSAADRVLAALARAPGEQSKRRSRFASRVAADRVTIRSARLEWLDRRPSGELVRGILEPFDLSLDRTRDRSTLEVEVTATLAQPAPARDSARRASLAARGTIAGVGLVTSLAEARIGLDTTLADADLTLLQPWLPTALGGDASIEGIAREAARIDGTLARTLTTQLSLEVANAAWNVPAAWPAPQEQHEVSLRAAIERDTGQIEARDLSLDSDDLHARGLARLSGAGTDAASIHVELESPWLELARVRKLLPVRQMGSALAYLARAIDGGRGRAERLTFDAALADLGHATPERKRDWLTGHLAFEGVSGVPRPGLARVSDTGGHLTIEHGDVSLDRFTARYGQSLLSAVSGTVRDVWGKTTLALSLDRGTIELTDLRGFLGSDVVPEAARAAAGQLEVSGGKLDASARVSLDFVKPLRFSGQGAIDGGSLRVVARDVDVRDLRGPVSFTNDRLSSTGLEAALGDSRVLARGSLSHYLADPSIDLELELRPAVAAQIYALLGERATASRPGGRVTGRMHLSGPLSTPARLDCSAALSLAGFDVGPPLVREPLGRVSGELSLEGDQLRFDLGSLVWHGYRARASGTVTGLRGAAPRVEVEGRTLETVDLARLLAAPSERGGAEETPTPWTVAGHARLESALFRGHAVDDLDVRFRYRPGAATIESATGRALGGKLSARAQVELPVDGPARVEIEPQLEGMDAAALLETLEVPWHALSGRADVRGRIGLPWPIADHLDELHGRLAIALHDGRIAEAVTLWKVLDLVDFSRWLTSPMAWRENGLEYRDFRGVIDLGEGQLATRDLDLRGPTVNLTLAGRLGLADRAVDGVVTVSPLQLLDRLLDPIPVIGDVKRGLDLTSYAFHVEGPLGDVSVTPETLDRVDSLLEQLLPALPGAGDDHAEPGKPQQRTAP